ncbi:MAG: PspC domain-containing protein [Actinomycetota bacterium]|jgi:phage shock protein C
MARRLARSKSDRKIAGVCGGVAEFFGVDSTTVRVLWVIAGIIPGGWGILPYVILWIVLPEEDEAAASSAVGVAEERYARGEITADELARIKDDLRRTG